MAVFDAVFAPHFFTNIFILLSVDAVFAPHFLTNFFILLSALPAFYSQSAFYPWSAVCSLQSAVGPINKVIIHSFTNTPLQLALDCTENAMKNSTVELLLPTDDIMDLLNLCLAST